MSVKNNILLRYITPEYFLLLFVLYSFVGINPFSIGIDEFNFVDSDSSFLRRTLYLGFFAISFLFFKNSKYTASMSVKVYWPYFIFAIFLLLSTLWSVEPGFTFVRATLYLISVFTLVFFICALNVNVFLRKLTNLFAALLILSFISIFILPTAKHAIPELAGNWRGIFSHKNDAGIAMVFSIIIFLRAYKIEKKLKWIFLTFLALVFLYFTESKTSMGFLVFGLLIGIFYAVFNYSFKVLKYYYFFLFAFIFLFLSFLSVTSFNFLDFIDDILYDPTRFTGRSMIWDYMLNLVMEKPVLGYGYNAIWGVGENSRLYDFTSRYDIWIYQISQGHNSYLDIVLSLGLLGLLIFGAIYIFSHIIFIHRNLYLDRTFVFVFYGFCSFFLFHGLMESNFLLVDKGRWTIFHILILLKARLLYELKRKNGLII